MSANLDLVRSIYVDWERGDFGSAEWADPEIEFVLFDVEAGVTGTSAISGPRKGLGGMAEAYREWLSAWEHARVAAEDFREIDDEHVLVLDRVSGRG